MSLIEKIDAVANEHPYKVVGDTDTYSQYNEGWTDACDRLEAVLSEQPKEPCEYCKNLRNNKNIIENDVFITGGNVLFANGESGYQRARINFCPMCGRPLKAD
jgi:hypothetical protein